MKKTYVTPDVEKVAFQYRDQVVAKSGGLTGCYVEYSDHPSENTCTEIGWKSAGPKA